MAKKQWRMSASLISTFKACAMRCNFKYALGIRPIEDTDSQRQGTNWHRCLEIMGKRSDDGLCHDCLALDTQDPNCPFCEGTGRLLEDPMDAVIRYLDKIYATVPMSKTKDEWLAERVILLYSLAGYNWHYVDDNYEVVAEELKFRLPLRNPATHRALPNVVIDGKIDKIVRSPEGIYYIDEHKSTSKAIESDDYWNHLNLDTQTRLYPWATRQMQLAGDLVPYGIKPDDPLISGVRLDVWHKPGIRPKKLTQADSKKFVETGEYYGEKFEVKVEEGPMVLPNEKRGCLVNGEQAEVEPGKKEGTFAIRETPEMYGNRLLQDIGERPEYYFARREINRTEAEFEQLEWQMYNIYKTLKGLEKNNAWWMDETQCEATFKCPYIPICYNNVTPDPKNPPEGFECIFKETK